MELVATAYKPCTLLSLNSSCGWISPENDLSFTEENAGASPRRQWDLKKSLEFSIARITSYSFKLDRELTFTTVICFFFLKGLEKSSKFIFF